MFNKDRARNAMSAAICEFTYGEDAECIDGSSRKIVMVQTKRL
jgi:hypothetical protein